MKALSLVSKTEVECAEKVASSIVEVAVVGQKVLSQGWVKSDSVELSGVVPRHSMWSSDGSGIQGEGHKTLLPRQKQKRGLSLSLSLHLFH